MSTLEGVQVTLKMIIRLTRIDFYAPSSPFLNFDLTAVSAHCAPLVKLAIQHPLKFTLTRGWGGGRSSGTFDLLF